MDPYYVHKFAPEFDQIEWSWTDRAFTSEPSGRSIAYYFRIIQSPTPGYNCRPIALLESGRSCDLMNPNPDTTESLMNPQDGSDAAKLIDTEDACYSDPDEPASFCEERAWTSPFYITRQ